MGTPGQTGQGNIVHVLFHGLFFMEYRNSQLSAVTPPVMGHVHFLGTPDKLTRWKGNFDFLNDLVGGNTNNFPPEMPQFSKVKTGVGNLKTLSGERTITLPQPIRVIPLRIGKFSDFPGLEGAVFASMVQAVNGNPPNRGFSMVTCLEYRLLPSKGQGLFDEGKCHFYAEPACDQGPMHLEMALKASKRIFSNPSHFDLEIDTSGTPDFIPFTNPEVPGLSQDDEQSLGELNNCASSTNVANCGQLGIH